MKKYLLFAIFLLLLLPALFETDYSHGYAQNMAVELDNIVVTGIDKSGKVKCDCCYRSFDDDESFQAHFTTSVACQIHYGITESVCALCNNPSSKCTCDGLVCEGTNKINSQSSGTGNTTTVDVGVGNRTSSTSTSSTTGSGEGEKSTTCTVGQGTLSSNTISMRDLKFKGVKLISYTKLPDKLYPQTRTMECIIRAFAFMAELKGHDYNTAYEVLTKTAESKNYDLDDPIRGGIPACDALTIFNSYCDISHGNYDQGIVQNYIDKGTAVALITVESPPHMVTVIGYDSDYYYTAAGDPNGNATIYQKNSLAGSGYIIFNNTKAPYK